MKKISLLTPQLPAPSSLLPYLQTSHTQNHYTNFGPVLFDFEKQVSKQLNAGKNTQVCAVSNATMGLELAISSLSLKPGSKILTPSFTFSATTLAILRNQCVPVFCDVDKSTLCLTPDLAEHYINNHHIDAILPVASFGYPTDTSHWQKLSEDTAIPIVIDAAAAFGNININSKIPIVFSLHATKAFSTGEGGLVTCNDARIIDKIRVLSNFGLDKGILTDSRGTNGKMSEYAAAVGLAMLKIWPDHRQQRIDLYAQYLEVISQLDWDLTTPLPHQHCYSTLPVLLPEGVNAQYIAQLLHSNNIESRRWYFPAIHTQKIFSDFPRTSDLPTTHNISHRLVGLPFHLFLTEKDIKRVCLTLFDALMHQLSAPKVPSTL